MSQEIIRENYPIISSLYPNIIDIVYPLLKKFNRSAVAKQIEIASFPDKHYDENIIGFLLNFNNIEDRNNFIRLIIKYLKIYTQQSFESVNSSYYNLDLDSYVKFYELKLVDYIFDKELFQNDYLIHDRIRGRWDLERFRDCYKTMYSISQFISYQQFYKYWNDENDF